MVFMLLSDRLQLSFPASSTVADSELPAGEWSRHLHGFRLPRTRICVTCDGTLLINRNSQYLGNAAPAPASLVTNRPELQPMRTHSLAGERTRVEAEHAGGVALRTAQNFRVRTIIAQG